MRVGINPEKEKQAKNVLKQHRIVVVFYVPDSEDNFYAELDQVLDKCLGSLIDTYNPETTNITLINNSSGKKVEAIVNKYFEHLDKYVHYSENKGKVYAVLNEVRGIFEEFVTISDADILFYHGWESAVFDVYKNHPKAGVVSPYPCPYVSFYFNKAVFATHSLLRNIAYGKHVADADIDLYTNGTNLPQLIKRKNAAFNWKEKQFILKNPKPAVIGAYHVVATYRTSQFRNVYTFPKIKFKNSYEAKFIDFLAEEKGLFRLSTLKSYIYHIGNTLDDVCYEQNSGGKQLLDPKTLAEIRPAKIDGRLLKWMKYNIGRLFIKLKWST